MTKKQKIDKYELDKIERQKAVDCLSYIQLTQIKESIDIMEDIVWQLKNGGDVFVRDLHRLEKEASDFRYLFNLSNKV